jgi:hypothetical protein
MPVLQTPSVFGFETVAHSAAKQDTVWETDLSVCLCAAVACLEVASQQAGSMLNTCSVLFKYIFEQLNKGKT